MQITDAIADMLTRIRNASAKRKPSVDIPASGMKMSIANILLAEGYVGRVEKIEDDKQGVIRITLRYQGNKPVITGLKRISKPGLRVYAGSKDLPEVLGGLGIALMSTSLGVMTGREAKQRNVGGEVLAFVW
ncbi:MAG: 30S ribosomal protein S8 [Clostridiaceae bacterium]|nr:30S ribosomal protein S8 [Clostridiaceae bacterium]